MKLFYDVFAKGQSNEVLSDGFKIELQYEGVVGKVQSAMVVQGEDNVDVGCGNEFGGKQQEAQGGANNNVVKVNNVLDTYKYQETSADIDQFTEYFKPYMKKLLEHLTAKKPERVQSFKKGAKQFFAWIKKPENFKQIAFYTPRESWDFQNCVIFSYYQQGAQAPIFLYMMDGLKQVKV